MQHKRAVPVFVQLAFIRVCARQGSYGTSAQSGVPANAFAGCARHWVSQAQSAPWN